MKLNSKRIENFEKYLEGMIKKHNIPGITVAIAYGQEIKYAKGFGYRSKEEEKEIDPDTILGIASISKSFGGLAITQLVEAGKMSFDDSVTKYFPNFDVPGDLDPSEIKVHHMLNHTAGFPPLEALGYSIRANTAPDEGEDRSEYTEDHLVNTIEELADFMSLGKYELLGQPGEYASYSNDCYGLIGGIVEKVSGLSFDKYARKFIFEPLKMNRSTFSLEEMFELGNVTNLYYEKDGEVKMSENWQEAPPYLACGWVRSTTNDLIKYAQMYANKGKLNDTIIVTENGIETMMNEGIQFTSHNIYGYGLMTQKDYNGLTLVEHGGSLKGVSSHFGFVPEKNISAVVLCNLSGVPVSDIWLAAINTALSIPIEAKRREYDTYEWSMDEIEPLLGEYISGEGAKINVFVKEDKIIINMSDNDYEITMVEKNLGTIDINGRTREVVFYQDEDKEAWALGYGYRIIPKKKIQ
jgi:CubicO group peptidase (beta-lactamase class C family)